MVLMVLISVQFERWKMCDKMKTFKVSRNAFRMGINTIQRYFNEYDIKRLESG